MINLLLFLLMQSNELSQSQNCNNVALKLTFVAAIITVLSFCFILIQHRYNKLISSTLGFVQLTHSVLASVLLCDFAVDMMAVRIVISRAQDFK